jgi:hypothetical protein
MGWVGANKDILSLLIALLAILVSLSTVLISLRNARTNSFIAMQNAMLTGEMQQGRLLIYKAIETGDVPPRDSNEEYLMVRTLAVFDLLGMFSRQGIVPRKWVLRFWHARLQLMRNGFGMEGDAGRPYILQGRPDLQDLIERAEHYRCNRTCCKNGQRERRLQWPERALEVAQQRDAENRKSATRIRARFNTIRRGIRTLIRTSVRSSATQRDHPARPTHPAGHASARRESAPRVRRRVMRRSPGRSAPGRSPRIGCEGE